MPTYTVFLSSTFADFARERGKLTEVLPYIDIHVSVAERTGDIGKSLSDTLAKKIDECEMVVLLLGSRAGTKSETGEPWAQKEVDYAFSKNKRVFAYQRVTPQESLSLVDRDQTGETALTDLLEFVQKKVAIVPRFELGECCKLTAMVIRDVDRYARELKEWQQQKSYDESFG